MAKQQAEIPAIHDLPAGACQVQPGLGPGKIKIPLPGPLCNLSPSLSGGLWFLALQVVPGLGRCTRMLSPATLLHTALRRCPCGGAGRCSRAD